MRTFEDTSGREWRVLIDAGAVARVAAECGIDLRHVDPRTCDRIAAAPAFMFGVLWAILRPQAEAWDIGREEFDRRIGVAVDAGIGAFVDAWVDALPPVGRRKVRIGLARNEN